MFSPDLVQKIRKAYSRLKSYRKVGRTFSICHSSVAYVVCTKKKGNREKKREPYKRLKPRLKGLLQEIKRLNAKSQRII